MKSPLTTHALDTSTGTPASGLKLTVCRLPSDKLIADAQCDANGRVSDLLKQPFDWQQGDYRIRFFTRDYFASKGLQCFYPYCDVVFTITDTSAHYHVPLLISPFGYTTYRGS